MSMKVHARCLCGAVAFELEGEPRSRSWCHCTMCRRAHGATPVAWVSFPRASLRFTAGALTWYASSAHARRGFCATCGSSMIFEDARHPDIVDVATAVLDEAADAELAPRRHIWAPSGLAWALPDDGLPRHVESTGSPKV
jgi:hypothetical protein